MCSNYETVTDEGRLRRYFGVELGARNTPSTVWPLGLAPFIRLAEDGSGNRIVEDGQFGLLPHFAKEVAYGRKTYNARSETVHQKPSFREAWRRGQRCIIPADVLYEPCYESGSAVRWAIRRAGDTPMAIAGVYDRPWHTPDGRQLWSFAMLTVNADGHPVYQRMHSPNDEKRMVVMLDADEYDRWLQCSPDEAKGFFKQWHGALEAMPAPLPARVRKCK